MGQIDHRAEVREFLSSRRARITPERAGLPAYGGNRRVKGLRREEVAMLAGVSIDYYVRMERGNLSGASDSVLDALARALQLDEAEREHLFALARAAGPGPRHRRASPTTVRPVTQQVLDAITDAPAWVRNGRHDILATNRLARALYAPSWPARAARRTPAGSSTSTRPPGSSSSTGTGSPTTCRHAPPGGGPRPHDRALIELIGELSTCSDVFRRRWASHDVQYHRSGMKRLRHPVVGRLDLDFESMELPSDPGLTLAVYTAAAGTPAADGLKMLASWAATQDLTEAPRPAPDQS
ncbi:helix-turn-helix transcriptional regulator [Nonomuraea thailandensis]